MQAVRPRRMIRYLGPGTQSSYGDEVLCGACGLSISGVYGSNYFGYPRTAADIERDNAAPHGLTFDRNTRSLSYYAFCPWCGVPFPDEWWKNHEADNERPVDHYQSPGHHKGDTHEFSGPECIEGHWLATNDEEVCWCDPIVTPGLLGCTVTHRDQAKSSRPSTRSGLV